MRTDWTVNGERPQAEVVVCAIIVTYQPDIVRLKQILRALNGTVYRAIVVDNGSPLLGEKDIVDAYPAAVLSRLRENRGIGAAQNEGIAIARSAGATHILFLDQDSVPETGMVEQLLTALRSEASRGVRVACIGPRVRLVPTGTLSVFRRIGWIRLRTIPCSNSQTVVECDFLISSGTLVPLTVLDDVGGMEEQLFIDQVDTEWCLRARAMRYKILGTCGAVLQHRLGESHRALWFGRWRRLPRHKPFRYYYIFRNTVLLCRRDYVSLKYALFQIKGLIALFLMYGVFTGERNGELSMMLKGLKDGLHGVTGKLASP